jgi:hypothetical protein
LEGVSRVTLEEEVEDTMDSSSDMTKEEEGRKGCGRRERNEGETEERE